MIRANVSTPSGRLYLVESHGYFTVERAGPGGGRVILSASVCLEVGLAMLRQLAGFDPTPTMVMGGDVPGPVGV